MSLKNLAHINTPFWLVNTIHCLLFILFPLRKYCLIRFWCKATSHWFWNSCQILALKPKSFDFADLFLSPENTILLDVKKASIFKNLLCSLVLYFLSASKLLVVLSGSSPSEGIFLQEIWFLQITNLYNHYTTTGYQIRLRVHLGLFTLFLSVLSS